MPDYANTKPDDETSRRKQSLLPRVCWLSALTCSWLLTCFINKIPFSTWSTTFLMSSQSVLSCNYCLPLNQNNSTYLNISSRPFGILDCIGNRRSINPNCRRLCTRTSAAHQAREGWHCRRNVRLSLGSKSNWLRPLSRETRRS